MKNFEKTVETQWDTEVRILMFLVKFWKFEKFAIVFGKLEGNFAEM